MRTLLVSSLLLALALPAEAALIFKSTMDNAAAITSPEVGTAGTIPGASYVTYVAGLHGNAAQVDNGGGEFNGVIWFPEENFDFEDEDNDGGRLDVILRFDQDPQNYSSNAWVLRTNYGDRRINMEMTSRSMMFDVYGEIAHTDRTNYSKFRVNPRATSEWQGVGTGEWHTFTWLWRNNGFNHKDEIHYYIDGVLVGSDYNGNLPVDSQLDQLQICPLLNGNEIDVTVDEIYGFDSWDMTGVPAGNYADLVQPEGVWITFPMDKDSPVWGSPADGAYLELAWAVRDTQEAVTDCDIWLNGANVATVACSTEVQYNEWVYPTPIQNSATNYVVVKCDGDRLVSSNVDFKMNPSTGVSMRVDWTVPNDDNYIVDSVQIRWDFDEAPTTLTGGTLLAKYATNDATGYRTLKGLRELGDIGVVMFHKGTLYKFPLVQPTEWTTGVTDMTQMTRVIPEEDIVVYPIRQ